MFLLISVLYFSLCLIHHVAPSSGLSQSDSEDKHVIPPGNVLIFPGYARLETLGIAPMNGGIIVSHKYQHPESRTLRSFWDTFRTLFYEEEQEHGFGYIISKTGDVVQSMYLADQGVGGYGFAESPEGSIGISYIQAPSIEKWCMYGDCINTKLTYHDIGVKPSMLIFDTQNRMWVPFVVFDRYDEEGEVVILLWCYNHDGSRWEVFSRRSFEHVRMPHAVHIDSTSRIFVAGLTEWIYFDSPHGQKAKEGIDLESVFTRMDVYRLVYDASSPEYVREQEARWIEMNGNDPSPTDDEIASIPLTASIALEVSYPFPYHICKKPLFVLTGDGYAITSCYGEKEISVMKIGEVISGPELYDFYDYPENYDLSQSDLNGPKEMWAPNPENVVRLYSSSSACVSSVFTGFYKPFESIGGIVMDPNGRSFSILDTELQEVHTIPWPLELPHSKNVLYEGKFADEEKERDTNWNRISFCGTEPQYFNAEDMASILPKAHPVFVKDLPN